MCTRNWEIFRYSGAQPVIFQSRRDFVKLGHFDFFKNTRDKLPQGKILELFLLDTLKTRFWMEDSTHFILFSQIRALFPIFKKEQRRSPSTPPPSTPLSCLPEIKNYSQRFLTSHKQVKMSLFYFMIGFPWSFYSHTAFLWCVRDILDTLNIYYS